MGDALRDGVKPADPDATIDASDGPQGSRPRSADAGGGGTDYAQLTTVDRRHYAFGPEIARGGMGRVLEARDLRLGRQVAIKELLPKNRDVARRFEREARITARLQHPAIIHIYEAGTWAGGEPFYAMPKVSGRSLDTVVAERATLDDRLALLPNVIAVADALAYAHNANVIHRDLKPANVIIGEFGETVVIDWGLAKDLGASTDPKESMQLQLRATADETVSGGIVGTPAYMPLEQARGEPVDQRADVYALGALLYKVLAGEPPYRGESSSEILEMVKAGPPVPIHERVPEAPADLIAIVAKAMAREPAARYVTAGELAKDLKRFQTGQLVGAHRYTLGELLVRWLRKHRVAVSIAAIAVVVLASVGVFTVQRVVSEKERAERERTKAETGRRQLLEERGREQLQAGHAGAALAYLIGAAHDGMTGGARGFLIADAMRPFQAQLAYVDGADASTTSAVSVDGTRVAIGGRALTVVDAVGHEVARFATPVPMRTVAIDATGARVAGGGEDGSVRVWTLRTGKMRDLSGHTGVVLDAAFSPDGTSLVTASGDGTARIWDLGTGTAGVSTCHTGPVIAARYSADGARIVTASVDATACVLDARTGATEVQIRGHTAKLNSAAFSPDGTLIITASDDGTARVWSVEKGKPVVGALRHDAGSSVHVALLTRDGRAITAGSDLVVRVWQLPAELPDYGMPATARLVDRFGGHTGSVVMATLNADETLLATGAFDRAAKVWDLETGQLLDSFEHGDVINSVSFVPGSAKLATASRDGGARLWQVQAGIAHPDVASAVQSIAVSARGTVAAGLASSRIVLFDGATVRTLHDHLATVHAVAFADTSAGLRLVSGGVDASPLVIDVATGKRIGMLGVHAETTRAIAVAPDGDTIALLVGTEIELWSLRSMTKLRVLPGAHA